MLQKPLPVTITERAIAEIQHIIEKKNIPKDYALRVGIRGSGGCSGLSFLLGFDKPKDNDDIYQTPNGFDVVVEKKHTMYVLGMQIDFEENIEERGFTFQNPDVILASK
jgi:iron-sulfur cluster assembly protein